MPAPEAWLRRIADWRDEFPLRYSNRGESIKPQWVLEQLQALTAGDDVIVTTGVGQHQMWAMQYVLSERPRSFITSGGLGTMGYGIPAAIGAKAARPEATVVCVDGDGCFQMTAQELVTAVLDDLPIVVVLVNNGYLGMVQQWQDMFFDGRRSHVHLTHQVPDYARLAEAYGAVGITVDARGRARARARGGALLRPHGRSSTCRVDQAEQCFPMIPAGAAALDMVEFEEEVEARREAHDLRHSSRTGPARSRASRRCSRAAASTSTRSPSGPTERPGVSCITLRVDCSQHSLEQIEKQIHKLVNVLRVTELRARRRGRAGAAA